MKRIPGKESYVGQSDYNATDILIEENTFKQMIITLKHELMHVWLFEHGHIIQAEGCFSYEDLCEYSALANNFINSITEMYLACDIM